ncbi:unnamed protein product [Caenorhabditis angaria]|uniref:Uncharacterized protein n=1 Tax=Caenorhabditis angaria TaxID=860376 RepID=A0A9P1N4T2_9PELO|nr:unnamed protein product [Caenorhabditis angaria]
MRFIVLALLSTFIATIFAGPKHPDATAEAKKFTKSIAEHQKAKNTTIIDPEFVELFANGTTIKRKAFVKFFLNEPLGLKFNTITGKFDSKGLLLVRSKGKRSNAIIGKRNASIKGGYSLYKFVEVYPWGDK